MVERVKTFRLDTGVKKILKDGVETQSYVGVSLVSEAPRKIVVGLCHVMCLPS